MKKRRSNVFLNHLPFIIFLAGFFFLVTYLIVKRNVPFYDWDESIYAQVGREMMRSKSFFVPMWQGRPWLDKPPVPSLFYGIVELLPFAQEITTRIATLILSSITLIFLYILGLKVTKSKTISLLSVIITAFLPIYFQRSQALNVDVFLLMGWLGYVIWYKNLFASVCFLLLATLSKSLLGFFPPVMFLGYHLFEYATKEIGKKQFISHLKRLGIQVGISSIWFIGMLLVYRYDFIQYHFIDSHFKRVTASIEQHFGQRTFYVTVLIDQFKLLLVPAFLSLGYLTYSFFKEKSKRYLTLLAVFFVPWFVFLNLTKTKIEWYIYPVLPQFALLASYPLIFLKKKTNLLIVAGILIGIFYFRTITPINSLLTQSFSSLEDHQLIAVDAKKNRCSRLFVLVGQDTRTSYKTLKSMDLVISTTTWWGNHPSIAYYADVNTTYLYSTNEALFRLKTLSKYECMIWEKNDEKFINEKTAYQISENKTYLLLQAR
ncbi:glycosyltransferase family 39 protein [Candidatus Roizmanbacteria bacterium]|nr:glycosyltransferase family 39 protein [Candidatus Roizmanbacteria bacterium]